MRVFVLISEPALLALAPPANQVRVRPDLLSKLVEFSLFTCEILLALLVFFVFSKQT